MLRRNLFVCFAASASGITAETTGMISLLSINFARSSKIFASGCALNEVPLIPCFSNSAGSGGPVIETMMRLLVPLRPLRPFQE